MRDVGRCERFLDRPYSFDRLRLLSVKGAE